MFKFKPEDFDGPIPQIRLLLDWASGRANELLAKEIETWPVVYGHYNKGIPEYWGPNEKDTHKARLAFIEPIVKKECKHEPVEYNINEIGTCQLSICKYCRIELIAEWKAK